MSAASTPAGTRRSTMTASGNRRTSITAGPAGATAAERAAVATLAAGAGAADTTVPASAPHTTPPAGNAQLVAAELAVTRCRWCNDELAHCHDTLVRHAIGEVHCMGADCEIAAELHHLVVSCADFACSCGVSAAVFAAEIA